MLACSYQHAGLRVFDVRDPYHPKRNDGPELQLWTVSDGNGLQVLRFTDNFKSLYRDLLQEAGE